MRSRSLFFTFIFAAAVWLLAPGVAQQRTTVTVLATTDLHGNIYPLDYYANRPANRGLAKIATLIARLRAEKPDALLIDCGDTTEDATPAYLHQRRMRALLGAPPKQGNGAIKARTLTHPMMLVMNRLKFDAMAVGNHEFNYGLPVLWKAMVESDFPWLSANITPSLVEDEVLALRKKQYGPLADRIGARTFDPMIMKEPGGIKVAIIGLTTPAIPNWEPPEHTKGYRFEDPVESAREWVRHARQVRQADLVIVAAHMGLERDPQTGAPLPQDSPEENSVYELANSVTGVDAIIFGHTHRELPQAMLNGVLLTQPRNWGQSLAEITFVLERQGSGWKVLEKRSRTIPVTGDTPADPEVLALVREHHERAMRYLDQPVARSRTALDAALGRVTDHPAVDAIHEVQLAAGKADVSLASLFNPGLQIPAGMVRVRNLAALYLYYNRLLVVETTGAALKQALEHSARFFKEWSDGATGSLFNPDVFGFNYDTAAGVTYQIDLSRPAGDRIVDLKFHGLPLAPGRKLRLAVNSYRKSGGGGYTMFRNAPVLWQSPADIRQLLIDYYTRRKVITWRSDHNWEIVPEGARRALMAEAVGRAR